jgi:peptidoglycan/xylan/chitin deacetylase (PgdA/CDA1 family)
MMEPSRVIYLPLLRFFQAARPGVAGTPVLIYHSITAGKAPSGLSIAVFKRHLDFLRENKYEVVPLADTLNTGSGLPGRLKPRRVSLTFDDGYEDFFYNCWPLLKEYGISATVFLVANNIGKEGYLKEDQIKEFSSGGLVTLGSHGMAHKYLIRLSDEDLKYEIANSKVELERRFGVEIKFFAYPWGAFSKNVKKIVRESGYRAAFTTNQVISGEYFTQDEYSLKRITMAEGDGFIKFLAKVSGFAYRFARRI